MDEKVRPGGVISTRELHFFWIVDCSGSMTVDGKIQSLNNAIREALPHMKTEADQNPHAKMILKAIKFSFCRRCVLQISNSKPLNSKSNSYGFSIIYIF